MTKTKWLIDKQMVKDTPHENLETIIKNAGYEVAVREYIPFSRIEDYLPLPYDEYDCVAVYGTIEFVKMFSFYIGSFLDSHQLEFANYFSTLKVPSEYYLNSDFVMTTLYDFKNNFEKYRLMFGTDHLFIRPNSGLKLFTGLDVDARSYFSEINALEQLSGAVDTSIILVAKAKQILDEFRFIIVNDEIVSSSSYSHSDGHNRQPAYYKSIPDNVQELANYISKAQDKPATCFTADIAILSSGQAKIIEINSFSSAGWYGCDATAIVTKVSNAVEKLYEEIQI